MPKNSIINAKLNTNPQQLSKLVGFHPTKLDNYLVSFLKMVLPNPSFNRSFNNSEILTTLVRSISYQIVSTLKTKNHQTDRETKGLKFLKDHQINLTRQFSLDELDSLDTKLGFLDNLNLKKIQQQGEAKKSAYAKQIHQQKLKYNHQKTNYKSDIAKLEIKSQTLANQLRDLKLQINSSQIELNQNHAKLKRANKHKNQVKTANTSKNYKNKKQSPQVKKQTVRRIVFDFYGGAYTGDITYNADQFKMSELANNLKTFKKIKRAITKDCLSGYKLPKDIASKQDFANAFTRVDTNGVLRLYPVPDTLNSISVKFKGGLYPATHTYTADKLNLAKLTDGSSTYNHLMNKLNHIKGCRNYLIPFALSSFKNFVSVFEKAVKYNQANLLITSTSKKLSHLFISIYKKRTLGKAFKWLKDQKNDLTNDDSIDDFLSSKETTHYFIQRGELTPTVLNTDTNLRPKRSRNTHIELSLDRNLDTNLSANALKNAFYQTQELQQFYDKYISNIEVTHFKNWLNDYLAKDNHYQKAQPTDYHFVIGVDEKKLTKTSNHQKPQPDQSSNLVSINGFHKTNFDIRLYSKKMLNQYLPQNPATIAQWQFKDFLSLNTTDNYLITPYLMSADDLQEILQNKKTLYHNFINYDQARQGGQKFYNNFKSDFRKALKKQNTYKNFPMRKFIFRNRPWRNLKDQIASQIKKYQNTFEDPDIRKRKHILILVFGSWLSDIHI